MDTSIIPQGGGIYQWRQISTGKKYIGSTNNFERRKKEHEKELRKGNHANKHLLRAWVKYGDDDFIFEIVETVDDTSMLLEREQWYLDNNVEWGNDFNGTRIATSPPSFEGKKHTVEAIQAIRQKNTGKRRTPEQNQRNSESKRGIVHDAEALARQAAGLARHYAQHPMSAERRQQISERTRAMHKAGKLKRLPPTNEELKRRSDSMKRTLAKKRAAKQLTENRTHSDDQHSR